MSEPSPKMKKVLKYIESDLGIKFEGSKKSFDDVKEFIDEHIEEWKKFKDNQEPSEGQTKGLKMIEENLGINYSGALNRNEVSRFLSEHLDKAFEAKSKGNSKSSNSMKRESQRYDEEVEDPFDQE